MVTSATRRRRWIRKNTYLMIKVLESLYIIGDPGTTPLGQT
jgi:hypothetical protein